MCIKCQGLDLLNEKKWEIGMKFILKSYLFCLEKKEKNHIENYDPATEIQAVFGFLFRDIYL